MDIKRAIAYVDGMNLYHGIIDRKNTPEKGYTKFSDERPWGDLLWLNIEAMIESYGIPWMCLQNIKFFEALDYESASQARQLIYMNALQSLRTIDEKSIFYGKYTPRERNCPGCGCKEPYYLEKRTDVAIGAEILCDVFLGKCEITILITGDSDQVPVIEKIKEVKPNQVVYVFFPPSRTSNDIRKLVGQEYCRHIGYKRLRENQLPDVIKIGEFTYEKPEEYRRKPNVDLDPLKI